MTQAAEKLDYKQTLNLPRTEFAMKADLVNNEPKRLAKWKAEKLYEQIELARQGGAKWILHDGPPFANGDIHIGHLINKTLKDVFVRFIPCRDSQLRMCRGGIAMGCRSSTRCRRNWRRRG